MTQTPIFSLRGVAFSYAGAAAPALRGVDLEIAQGEWVALVGANGSGKSTLAKLCNALLLPTQGVCLVLGHDTNDASRLEEIRASVALVFQNPEDQIVASIVEEDVAFGPENLELPPNEIQRRVADALVLAGLSDKRKVASHSLSGGQKQRLALAGALALEPKALILDESTSMLDPEGREAFLRCLGGLNERGLTIVQITHRMEEAIQANRIVVIDCGCVVWDGKPVDFFAGEYMRWDFEVPPEVALYRELRAHDLVASSILPTVDKMLETLCLSQSKA